MLRVVSALVATWALQMGAVSVAVWALLMDMVFVLSWLLLLGDSLGIVGAPDRRGPRWYWLPWLLRSSVSSAA